MEFRCGLNEADGMQFGCQNGGVCNLSDTIGQFCECPPGWTHDFVGCAHFRNCALPVDFLRIFFIVFTVVFWLTMFVVLWKLRLVKSRGKMRTLSFACIIWSLFSWIHLLCVYLQDGFYEAGVVSFALIGINGYWIASYVIPLLFAPIAMRAGLPRIAQLSSAITWSAFTVQLAISIGLSGVTLRYCSDPNPAMFNKFMIIFLLEQCTAVMMGSIWTFQTAFRLQSLLPETAIAVKKQVTLISTVSILTVATGALTGAVTVVWIFYSSVPFIWIVWVIMHLLFLGILWFQVPLAMSLKLKPAENGVAIHRVNSEEKPATSEQTSTNLPSPELSKPIGLGIAGMTAMKWKRSPRSKGNSKQLSRVTEVEDEMVASIAT